MSINKSGEFIRDREMGPKPSQPAPSEQPDGAEEGDEEASKIMTADEKAEMKRRLLGE